ncbi:MAG: hypothetical protein ABSD48_00220 [Armatimonadota bacterium]|jgi:hypothetical protein
MRAEDIDQALSTALRAGLALSETEKDALWDGFTARARGEAQAWAFFMAAMIRTTARIRPASIRSSWANRSRSAGLYRQ